MSVIIRLQNLPWSANALDIRQFFRGLSIPEGGVHIVGGELGDAFIAFSTDEDARQAFNLNGGKIKEVQIKLLLSSRTEMQKVIEAARNPLAAFMPRAGPAPILPTALPAIVPAAVPEVIKKNDKRDRRRSRSRSRDRRDRSRERERRRRDRSRSRSRDRRDRRRRDRSRSRDRRSKDNERNSNDRMKAEEKNSTPETINTLPIVTNIQKETNQAVVWTNNVPVVQTPSILNSLLPAHLQNSNLLLNYSRNGLQNPAEALSNISRVVNAWNFTHIANQSERRNFQDELKAVSNIIGGANKKDNSENRSRSSFNKSQRVSRFDSPKERVPLHPPTVRGPHPLDRLGDDEKDDFSDRNSYEHTMRADKYERDRQIIKGCCIELKSFFGGYSEIRKFFNGLFIHNNGIKFLNDDFGKRTGVVYIRFASPTGKERAIERNGMFLRDISIELSEISDEIFDNAVDRYQPPLFNDGKQIKDGHKYKDVLSECSCLVIEDLPLFTKEQDLLKIFVEYPLQQIILVNKQRHMVGYVKFATAGDAQKAAKEKEDYCFDNRSWKIRLCPENEYNVTNQLHGAIDTTADEDEPQVIPVETDCLALSGLPKKTTDRDVSDFFSDVAIIPKKIHLISSNLGFTGQAYCEFFTVLDTQTALQKHGLPLGSGIVKVKPIPRSEMEVNIGQAIPREPVRKPLLSNPPINSKAPNHNEPVLENTSLEMELESRNSGISNDEMFIDDYEESQNARPHDPSLDSMTNYELQSLQNSKPHKELYDQENYEFSRDDNSIYDPQEPVENYEDLRNYDDGNYDAPHNLGNFESLHNAPHYEESDYELQPSQRPFERPRNNRPYGPNTDHSNYDPARGLRRFDVPPNSRIRNYEPLPPSISRSLPLPLMGINRSLAHQLPPADDSNDITPLGCTVLMENVPYKAGLDEILNFFEGFNVQADNVLRRYNDNGTPSGEAKVIFNTKEEAHIAVQECNLLKLRERTVYLTQC